MGLTSKQKAILDFIATYTHKHGVAPTQQDIARYFGFRSLGTVQNYVVRLIQQGFLENEWNAKRGMKVKKPPPPTLPLLGWVAAGHPIEAIENQEIIDVPPAMVKQGIEHFALRVKGNSMIEEGIHDDDLIVVRRQCVAHNGQTVVALIDNEATVKRYYQHNNTIELRAANPDFQSIVVHPYNQTFKIEGVVVGVIRYLSAS